MESKGRRVRRRREIQIEVNYPSGVQFYSDPPTGDILLTEFDGIASDRLKILRTVEHLNLLGYVKDSDEWINKLYEEFSKNKFFINAADKDSKERVDEIQKARRQDHVSHFILRLVFCRSKDLRQWFVDHETDLFQARLLYASRSGLDLKAFLVANNLKYLIVAEEEQERQRENLIAGSFHVGEDNIVGMTFYKVPFTDALELVRQRKVSLKAGLAYVPEGDVATLVINSFRTHLSRAVANAYKALPEVESDERLVCLLKDFDKRHIAKDYLSRKPVNIHITPDMIDRLANKSFPLCMRQLNDVLRSTHHLKHHGRLIYGLFLKAAGLSMEDSLTFWRSHFLQIMDEDVFRKKKYAYGIRYNYGKEGMRKDFPPYGCMKIIGHSPGPSEAHGCPFRHTGAPLLRQRLAAYGVSQQVIHEIMVLVSKQHYQAACQCFWEALHGVPIEGGIDHPNQFFEESYMLLNGSAQPSQGKKHPEVKATHSVMCASQASSQSTQASSQSTQASSQPTQASSQPTQASSQPTQASSQPTQASSQPTQAPPGNTKVSEMEIDMDDEIGTAMLKISMEGLK